MNCFFLSMHSSFSRSLSVMLKRAGHRVYTPDFAFAHAIRGNFKNSFPMEFPGVSQLSQEEFGDTPMDILFLLCKEQELGQWWQLVKAPHPKATVVHYSGNDHTGYEPSKVDFLLAADSTTAKACHPKHQLNFFPILPYQDLPEPEPNRAERAQSKIGSYVQSMEQHWPVQHAMFTKLLEMLKGYKVEGLNHSGAGRQVCWEYMLRSLLTVHFKGAEGYGYSVLESLAMGVPVISTKALVFGRTLEKFFIHGQTGWVVEGPTEALNIIDAMNHNRPALQAMGQRAYNLVRTLLNEEQEVANLKLFLEQVAE